MIENINDKLDDQSGILKDIRREQVAGTKTMAGHDIRISNLEEIAKETSKRIESKTQGIKKDAFTWVIILISLATLAATIIFNLK